MSTKFPPHRYSQKSYHRANTHKGQGHRIKTCYRPNVPGFLKAGFRISDQTLWVQFGSGKIYSATGYTLERFQASLLTGNPFKLWGQHLRKLTHDPTSYSRQEVFADDCDLLWTTPA